ncbi:MAG: glutaredoxin family protein [Stackebrandtia sp.]
MARLKLLTTRRCHLCANARTALARVARRAGVDWEEVDVAEDAFLRREYGDRLPVVLLDGVEHGYWDVDEARLLRDLGVDA